MIQTAIYKVCTNIEEKNCFVDSVITQLHLLLIWLVGGILA